ncbi:hypothetical protein [Cellulomonas sp. Marseille-Q8402]
MIGGAVFLLVSFTVLSVLGLAVLAPMRRLRREVLLPAAPLLGAALLAVVLSTTSYWLTARGGLLVTVVVAAALVATAVVRRTRPWRFRGSAVGLACLAVALGVPGMLAALVPSFWLGTVQAVSPNQSHDIFYYVSEAAWLAEHPISPVPQVGTEPVAGAATPGYASVTSSLALPLRVGQPMVQAALNAVSGQDAVASAMAVNALWVLLLAPAAFVAARLLRVRTGAAACLALVTASSMLVVQQVYQQNVDSLLGGGLALLSIGLCIAAAHGRVPVGPAALALAALVAVYTEYALYVGPAVVGGILLTRPRGWSRRLLRALAVVGLAVVITPTSWVRGIGTVLIRRDGDLMDSPLFSDGWGTSLARAVGTLPFDEVGSGSKFTPVLIAVLVVGWLLALLIAPYRGAWIGLLGVGLGYVAVLTAGHHGYTQMRAVALLLPLVLLPAAAGWGAAVHRAVRATRPGSGRRWSRPAARWAVGVVSVGLIAMTVAGTALNLRSVVAGLDRDLVESRAVDADFREAARWVAERGGTEGEGVTVVAPDLFDQMWVAYELRDEELVSYVALRRDYLLTGQYWAGEADRWLLVGRGAAVDAPDAAVVAQNDRFRLLDTSLAPVAAAVPGPADVWYPFAIDDAVVGPLMVGPDLGDVLLWRSEQETGPLELELRVPVSTSVAVSVDGGPAEVLPVVDQTVRVPVAADVPSGAVLTVDLAADGEAEDEQFELRGVHRVG